MMNDHLWRRAVVLLLSVALAGSCGTEAGTEANRDRPPSPGIGDLDIGVAANPVFVAPFVDFDDDHGQPPLVASVNLTFVRNPDEFRANLTSGRFDVATLPVNVAVNLANRGVDVRLIGVVDAHLLHVVGLEAEQGWTSLRGRTVHVAFRGDIADLLLRALASEHGLAAGTDYEIAYHTGLPEVATAIAGGSADLAVLPEPFASLAIEQASTVDRDLARVLDLHAEWAVVSGTGVLPAAAVIVRGSLIDAEPKLADQLALRLTEQTTAVANRPADDAAAIAAVTDMPESLIVDLVPRLHLGFRRASDARDDLEAFLQTLVDQSPDVLGGPPPGSDFYAS